MTVTGTGSRSLQASGKRRRVLVAGRVNANYAARTVAARAGLTFESGVVEPIAYKAQRLISIGTVTLWDLDPLRMSLRATVTWGTVMHATAM